MSSEIYYDRAYIRVGDRFIPVVNHGSSNCFDFDACGREVPEKHWSVLNYTFHGRQLFTEEEIRQIAAIYEAANSDNRDGILMRQSSPRICLVRRLHHAEVELRPLIKTQLAKEQIIYLCADIADENSKNPMEK